MEECRILTTRAQLDAIKADWDALCERSAVYFFSDHGSVTNWMDTVGQTEPTTYHIVTRWHKERLTGLLPLVVTRKNGLRLLRWVGHDVFYGPIQLYETPEDRENLWRTTLSSPHYDIAKIKYLFDGTIEHKLVTALPSALLAGQDLMTFNLYDGKGSDEWFAALSPATRKEHRRNISKLEKAGPVTFRAMTDDEISPELIDTMVGFKQSWTQAKNKQSGIFHTRDFMQNMVAQARATGTFAPLELKCGQERVTLQINFRHGDMLYCYMATRNPAWAKYSPGAIAMILTALWAANNGFRLMHLLEGSDSYKQRYTNGQESFGIYMFARTIKGRVALFALSLLKKFRR